MMDIIRLSRFNDVCRPNDPLHINTLLNWCREGEDKPLQDRKLPGAFHAERIGWQVDLEVYQAEMHRRAVGGSIVDKVDDPVLATALAILKGAA